MGRSGHRARRVRSSAGARRYGCAEPHAGHRGVGRPRHLGERGAGARVREWPTAVRLHRQLWRDATLGRGVSPSGERQRRYSPLSRDGDSRGERETGGPARQLSRDGTLLEARAEPRLHLGRDRRRGRGRRRRRGSHCGRGLVRVAELATARDQVGEAVLDPPRLQRLLPELCAGRQPRRPHRCRAIRLSRARGVLVRESWPASRCVDAAAGTSDGGK